MNRTTLTALRRWSATRAVALTATIVSLVAAGCSDDPAAPTQTNEVAKFNAEVPIAWVQLQLVLTAKTPGWTPPVTSRAYGYIGVAGYEAVVPGMPDAKSLVGQLNGLTSLPAVESGKSYHWNVVANAALARITKLLWGNATAEYIAKIDSLENVYQTRFTSETDAETLQRSIDRGRAVADAVFEWSKTDGGHEGYSKNFPTTYTPPTGDGFWVPTAAGQLALQPYWGQNRPFVLPAGGDPNVGIDPGAPPAWSTTPGTPMYQDAHEVYTTWQTLDASQKATADYWADGGETCTPPGHSMSILCQCWAQMGSKLDFTLRAYALMGIGQADAFIACWASKYKYNLMRPITYIKTYIDTAFVSYIGTPPFPEYTSGHSTQSGAMSVIMSSLFGDSFSFSDNTHAARGYTTRSYTSFEQCAQEAAVSRLYGGIHFRTANERGVTVGKKVGQKVLTLDVTK